MACRPLNNATRVFRNDVAEKINELLDGSEELDFGKIAPYAAGRNSHRATQPTLHMPDQHARRRVRLRARPRAPPPRLSRACPPASPGLSALPLLLLGRVPTGTRTKAMWQQTGDWNDSMWSCGQSAGLIDDVPTCKALVERMVAEAEQQLTSGVRAVVASRL